MKRVGSGQWAVEENSWQWARKRSDEWKKVLWL